MKSNQMFVLFAAWQATVVLAAGVTWMMASTKAPAAQPISLSLSLDDFAKKGGHGNDLSKQDNTDLESENELLRRKLARVQAERESLSDSYLRLALERLCDQAISNAGPSKALRNAMAQRNPEGSETIDGFRDQLEDALSQFETSPESDTPLDRLLDAASQSGFADSTQSASLFSLLSALQSPGALEDLLQNPDLMDRAGSALETLDGLLAAMDGMQPLGGALGGLSGGLGQGLSQGMSALQPLMEMLAMFRQAGAAADGSPDLSGLLQDLAPGLGQQLQNDAQNPRALRVLRLLALLRQ